MQTKQPFYKTTAGILIGCGALVLLALLCVCVAIGAYGAYTAFSPSSTATPKVIQTNPPASPTSSVQTKPSGFITSVTLAQATQGDSKDPVSPTNSFGPSATFHAVVRAQNAPANTKFEAVWYAVDTGGAATPNTLIDQTELVTEGTRNIDFTLAPTTTWPPGSYRVEIYVNGALDTVKSFTVK